MNGLTRMGTVVVVVVVWILALPCCVEYLLSISPLDVTLDKVNIEELCLCMLPVSRRPVCPCRVDPFLSFSFPPVPSRKVLKKTVDSSSYK